MKNIYNHEYEESYGHINTLLNTMEERLNFFINYDTEGKGPSSNNLQPYIEELGFYIRQLNVFKYMISYIDIV